MKKKWKRRLITLFSLTVAVIAYVEFDKWQKGRVEPCASGICPIPRENGLSIDPFPEEIVPQGIETNQSIEGAIHE